VKLLAARPFPKPAWHFTITPQEKAFARYYVNTAKELRRSFDRPKAIAALERHPMGDEVLGAFDWTTTGTHMETLRALYRRSVITGGQAGAGDIFAPRYVRKAAAQEAGVGFAFDMKNPLVENYVTNNTGKLITAIDSQTRSNVRGIIFKSYQQGLGVPATANLVQGVVGLSGRWSTALQNYQTGLVQSGMSGDMLDSLVARYSDRLLSARGELIARTELLDAQNQGRAMAWEQALSEGLISTATHGKEWVATGDDRTCEDCDALDGEVADINDNFSSGDDMPPAHPDCRCTADLVELEGPEAEAAAGLLPLVGGSGEAEAMLEGLGMTQSELQTMAEKPGIGWHGKFKGVYGETPGQAANNVMAEMNAGKTLAEAVSDLYNATPKDFIAHLPKNTAAKLLDFAGYSAEEIPVYVAPAAAAPEVEMTLPNISALSAGEQWDLLDAAKTPGLSTNDFYAKYGFDASAIIPDYIGEQADVSYVDMKQFLTDLAPQDAKTVLEGLETSWAPSDIVEPSLPTAAAPAAAPAATEQALMNAAADTGLTPQGFSVKYGWSQQAAMSTVDNMLNEGKTLIEIASEFNTTPTELLSDLPSTYASNMLQDLKDTGLWDLVTQAPAEATPYEQALRATGELQGMNYGPFTMKYNTGPYTAAEDALKMLQQNPDWTLNEATQALYQVPPQELLADMEPQAAKELIDSAKALGQLEAPGIAPPTIAPPEPTLPPIPPPPEGPATTGGGFTPAPWVGSPDQMSYAQQLQDAVSSKGKWSTQFTNKYGESSKTAFDYLQHTMAQGQDLATAIQQHYGASLSTFLDDMKPTYAQKLLAQAYPQYAFAQTGLETAVTPGVAAPTLPPSIAPTLAPAEPVDLGPPGQLLETGFRDTTGTPFDLADLKRAPQSEQVSAGFHAKEVYQSPDGSLWMFKDTSAGKPYQAYADELGNKIRDLVGLSNTDTYTVTMPDGRFGSLQRLYGASSERRDFFKGAVDVARLKPDQLDALSKNQVIDWLTSNMDAHPGQFMRVSGSMEPKEIDFGQAFKFFGKDSLDASFNPNPEKDIYSYLDKAFSAGKLDEANVARGTTAADQQLLAFINKVQALDDNTIEQLLRPYAESAKQAGVLPGNSVEQFIAKVEERRDNLLSDFRAYQQKLLDQRMAGEAERAARAAEQVKDIIPPDQFTAYKADTLENAFSRTWWDNFSSSSTANERAVSKVRSYTGSSYSNWNSYLRVGKLGTNPTMDKSIAQVQQVLSSAGSPENMITYRRASASELRSYFGQMGADVVADPSLAVGRDFTFPSFMSTTTHAGAGASYGSPQIVFQLPKGTPGAFVKAISQFSMEDEWLTGYGLRARVLEASPKKLVVQILWPPR
jgi:SPP1 gp7 family putative phage head morphogenesis protein